MYQATWLLRYRGLQRASAVGIGIWIQMRHECDRGWMSFFLTLTCALDRVKKNPAILLHGEKSSLALIVGNRCRTDVWRATGRRQTVCGRAVRSGTKDQSGMDGCEPQKRYE